MLIIEAIQFLLGIFGNFRKVPGKIETDVGN
jgi:hypothetical protein